MDECQWRLGVVVYIVSLFSLYTLIIPEKQETGWQGAFIFSLSFYLRVVKTSDGSSVHPFIDLSKQFNIKRYIDR